jgi:hypothetical protein
MSGTDPFPAEARHPKHKKTRARNDFVELVKSLLNDAGFKSRRNRCTATQGKMRVEVSFRNRWGWPIPDLYLVVSHAAAGDLLQADLRHLFPGLFELRAEFADEELVAMNGDTKNRVSSVVASEVVPQVLALANRHHFLEQLDAGRFVGSGVYIAAVEKLRAMRLG